MTTGAGKHQPVTGVYPAARLVSATGATEAASPEDAGQQLAGGTFFWLDLESQDSARLTQFGRSLQLDGAVAATLEDTGRSPDPGMVIPAASARRPSFAASADAIQALVLASGGQALTAAAIPVRIVYTGQFLLTVHSGPCPALDQARQQYDALREAAKSDGSEVLFLVLDGLVGSFEPQLLALDARLDEIQVELLTGSRRGAEADLLAYRRWLSAAVQAMGWYTGDLEDVSAVGIGQLPGMGPSAQGRFDRHYAHVTRMTHAAQGYRDEAGEALGQYSANISGRQGQVINVLAVISVVFLPLTFLTGYFGMNFDVVTQDLKTVWIFILLGNVLPAASVVLGIVLFRRWIARLGVPKIVPAAEPAVKPEPARTEPGPT